MSKSTKGSNAAVVSTKGEVVASKRAKRAAKVAKRATRKATKPAAEPEVATRKVAALPQNTVAKEYSKVVRGVPVSVTPVQGRGGNRITLWEHPITAVLRWCGYRAGKGWSVARCRTLLAALGLSEVLGNTTLGCQFYGCRIHGGGVAAELSKEQAALLCKLAPEPKA